MQDYFGKRETKIEILKKKIKFKLVMNVDP